MSDWYDAAATEIVSLICPSENAGHEPNCGCDDCRMLQRGRAYVAADTMRRYDSGRWMSVAEQLPPLHEAVLLCLPVSGVRIGYRGESKNGSSRWMAYGAVDVEHVEDPTHWRKIVAPEVAK